MFRVVSVLFVEKQFWTKPEEIYVALLTMKSYQHFRVSKSWAKVGYFFYKYGILIAIFLVFLLLIAPLIFLIIQKKVSPLGTKHVF